MIRIANQVINLEDIFHAEYSTDPSRATIQIVRGGTWKELVFQDGDAEYIMGILDIKHFATVNQLRKEQETI